jgi:hypothetical protein
MKTVPNPYPIKMVTFFQSKLIKGPNECWLWQGTTDQDGYGILCFKYEIIKAHRFAYHIYKGHIADGTLVLHTCDVPGCCNPAHLYLGTVQDNINDRTVRNRTAHNNGTQNGQCKLSDVQVDEIRNLRYMGLKTTILAKQFGVSHQQISRICTRKERIRG